MTTLSTHDTKRSEDTRARISVLAELAPEWKAALARLQELAPLPDGPLANLLWQAIAGAWPADRDRLQSYAQKAAREAGNSTDWLDPDADFEEKLHGRRRRGLRRRWVRAELEALVALLAPYGAVQLAGAPSWSS